MRAVYTALLLNALVARLYRVLSDGQARQTLNTKMHPPCALPAVLQTIPDIILLGTTEIGGIVLDVGLVILAALKVRP